MQLSAEWTLQYHSAPILCLYASPTKVVVHDTAYCACDWTLFILDGAALQSCPLAPSDREKSADHTRITAILEQAAGNYIERDVLEYKVSLPMIRCPVSQSIYIESRDVLRRSA